MGIIGLQKFIENEAKVAFEHVNLSEIADLYRNKMKRDPLMLIDISSCVIYMGFQNEKIMFMKGELKKFKENIEKFCYKCSGLGIMLRVVLDGLKNCVKQRIWLKKEHRNSLNLKKMYSGEQHIIKSNYGYFINIALMVFHCANNCEVWRSLYDADADIINSAKKNNCFAILSNDTDFLLAEGVQYLLSPKYLNLDSMTTYNYNRNRLAEFLDISESQFPVYASLCFHTDFDQKELQLFYKINNIKWADRFTDVAKFVRNLFLEAKNVDDLNDIHGLDKKWKERLNYLCGTRVDQGLQPIGVKTWDDILNLAKENFHAGLAHRKVYGILRTKRFYISTNDRNVLKISPSSAMKSFRKKIYGILFFEYPESKISVTEYSFETFRVGFLPKYNSCKVSFIRRFHPGLLTLWSPFEASLNEARKQRIKVFSQALNEKLSPDDLISEDIPEELLFPVLAAFLMHCEFETKISALDVKIILIQAIIVHRSTSEEIMQYPDDICLIAVELSDWFLRTIDCLYLLNSTCGNPFSRKTDLQHFFDGKVFHYVCAKAKVDGNFLEILCNKDTHYTALKRKFFELELKCGHVQLSKKTELIQI